MKRAIRAILKIPATFVVVPFIFLLIAMSYATSAVFWLYETNKWDVRANQDARTDLYQFMKEWFTTI